MGSRSSNPCGASTATRPKEVLISMCIGYALNKAHPIRERYCVFDLNAGRPVNHVNSSYYQGTTQTVLKKLQKEQQSSALWWVDKRKKIVIDLQAAMPCQSFNLFGVKPLILCEVVKADNREFVLSIPKRIEEIGQSPAHTRGVIIADPNGIKIPLEGIRAALINAPYLDVAIHVCAFRQVWAYWDTHQDLPGFKETVACIRSFAQIFDTVPRRSWLISEPFRPKNGAGRDHCVLYGSHLPYLPPVDKHYAPRMYLLNSEDGRALLARLERPGY